jgi:signal transduction histidine kinase
VKKITQVKNLFISCYRLLVSACSSFVSFFLEAVDDAEWLMSHRFYYYSSALNRPGYDLYANRVNDQLKKQSLTGSIKNVALVSVSSEDRLLSSVASVASVAAIAPITPITSKAPIIKSPIIKSSMISMQNNKAAIDDLNAMNKPDSINKVDSISLIAAGIAHEMNNPLGFVSSNLTTLQEYAESLKKILMQKQYLIGRLSTQKTLSRIELMALDNDAEINYILGDLEGLLSESMAGVARVQKIIEDLSEISPFELLETSDEDINKVLDSTLSKLGFPLSQNIQLIKEYDALLLTKVSTDKLNQAFLAIINNAAQAIHARGDEANGKIILRTTQLQRHIRIDVIDNGCGIPEEKLTAIFDPFYTTRNVGEGVGLGLHMAKNVAESHGGALSVSSQMGIGTVLTVILPVGDCAIDAADWPMDTQMSL